MRWSPELRLSHFPAFVLFWDLGRSVHRAALAYAVESGQLGSQRLVGGAHAPLPRRIGDFVLWLDEVSLLSCCHARRSPGSARVALSLIASRAQLSSFPCHNNRLPFLFAPASQPSALLDMGLHSSAR
jgi:hypothetical protein